MGLKFKFKHLNFHRFHQAMQPKPINYTLLFYLLNPFLSPESYIKKKFLHIHGYVVEGTLAKTIINEPKEVTLMNGLPAPLNMQVHYISFSSHADFAHTSTFLKELMPPNIIPVHGEANEMGRLKQKLITQFADRNTKIISPNNCQSVEMYFNSEKRVG